MRAWKDRLARSIVLVVFSLLVAHTTVIVLVATRHRIPASTTLLYLAVTLVWHLFLTWILVLKRDLFVIERTGVRLERVNLSSMLTLARLTSLPGVLYVFQLTRIADVTVVIVLYVGLAFTTDLLDGLLARRLGEITRAGSYLDAATDYMVLAAIVMVFRIFRLIPGWFFALVFFRLGVMALGSIILVLLRSKVEPETSPAGKASVFAMMVFFGFKILQVVIPDSPDGGFLLTLLAALELLAAAVVAMAAVEKIHSMGKRIAMAVRQRRPSDV